MSQVMSASDDNDYPDLDLTTSSQENQMDDDIQEHVVGRPPESDIDGSEEQDSFVSSGTGTGSEPFPIDDYEYTVIPPQPEPLAAMPDDLVANVQDDAATVVLTDFMGNPLDFVTIIFTSCLASFPLRLKNGFDPEELNKSTLELLGFDLVSVGEVLLGEKMDQLANRSKTEVAHALAKEGWLECRNSRFYPVLPESELETVASLIEGSEKLVEREDRKKREAETYVDVESEERALITFNMIVELMNAVREDMRNQKVPYQRINQAFMDMVTGHQRYERILSKYTVPLALTSDMRWNSPWFNKYTNRSGLKKFVQMGKFSEIVVTDTSHYYFRADDDGNRPVRMFTDADIREVRDKWASGNERNTNYGNNVGRGGQRAERNGLSYQQQPKRQVEADPNYRSSTFAGGISSTYDDGSLEPSTSTRQRDNQPSTSARAFRRTPSPSPVRQENVVADTRFAQDQSSGSRASSPEPPRRTQPNPFGGKPVQSHIEEDRRRSGNGGHGSGYQPRQVTRVQDYGESSSEGEITSEGFYSDDDEETRAEKTRKRVLKKKKKEEHEMKRREIRARQPYEPPAPRFQPHSYYRRVNETREPEEQSQVEVHANDREDAPAAASAPSQAAPVEQTPVVQQPTHPVSDNENIAPSSVTPALPIVVSSSRFDGERIQGQLPYRPADGVMEKNKAEENAKKNRELMVDSRARSIAAQSGVPPAPLQHPNLQARAAPGQDPSRQYSEPITTNGFANARNHAQPAVTAPPCAPQPPPNTEEEYHGRNSQGPRHSQQAPPQQVLPQQMQPQQAPPQQLQQPFQHEPYQQQPQPPFQPQFQQSQPYQQAPQYAPQPHPQNQQFQGASQYNYSQHQQQQQPLMQQEQGHFQPSMQQQQPMHYQNQYQREPMNDPSFISQQMMRPPISAQHPMHSSMNPQPYPMNAGSQAYAPSLQGYGNPNQHYGNMASGPPSMYNQPPQMGRPNNINFNRPQHTYNTARPSASISFASSGHDGRGGSPVEKMRNAVMAIYFKFRTANRVLYKEDLEEMAKTSEYSSIFSPYFNFAEFIDKEMRGQLMFEYTRDSRLMLRQPHM